MDLSSLMSRFRAAYEVLRRPALPRADDTTPVSGHPTAAISPNTPVAMDEGSAEVEAARRLYEEAREHDPFPEVAPALLNSAHIEDYALATAMVHPFESARRKSASYPLRIGSTLAFGDPNAPAFTQALRALAPRERFSLPPNSLVYVQTKELFQLPNYIAVRFNLHIELVHKGLLLGTGPLVDPGFRGRLVIPLHNMTGNEYILAEGDDIIWAEFTKTSVDPAWRVRADARAAEEARPRAAFAPFPSDKSNLTMTDYFTKALKPHEGEARTRPYEFPANATPAVIAEAGRRAAQAAVDAAAAKTSAAAAASEAARIRISGIFTIAGVGLALITLIVVTWQMVQATTGMAKDTSADISKLAMRLSTYQHELADRDARLASAAVGDLCNSKAEGFEASKYRLEASRRVYAAEGAATWSATAAGLADPFPIKMPVSGALPPSSVCDGR